MDLARIVSRLDRLLTSQLPGDSSANGLQVGGQGQVEKVAFAVDANQASFEKAIKEKAQLLIVHHGLIWKEPIKIIGYNFQRIQLLIENKLALYAVHLPLDLHPRLGNNANLLQMLGLRPTTPFAAYASTTIGYSAAFREKTTVQEIQKIYQQKLGFAGKLYKFGPNEIKTVAVVSGGGGGKILKQAIENKFDLFITGEISHSDYSAIEDSQINVLALGHYLSETVGLKALANYLKEKYKLETCFIEHPTGL